MEPSGSRWGDGTDGALVRLQASRCGQVTPWAVVCSGGSIGWPFDSRRCGRFGPRLRSGRERGRVLLACHGATLSRSPTAPDHVQVPVKVPQKLTRTLSVPAHSLVGPPPPLPSPLVSKTTGIAFPTCLSVNGTLQNFSPLPSDAAASVITLASDDVLKISLGAHIDGYAVVSAET